MSVKAAKGYDFFKDNPRHETEIEKKKAKWIRARDGVDIYSISRPKLISLATEAGAAYKIDTMVLIDTEAFELYLESFRIPGAIAK